MPSVLKFNNNEIIDSSGKITATAFPSSCILQVQVTTTDSVSQITSSSFTDASGMSVNITPTKTGSKILLYLNFRFGNSSSSDNGYRILRDSTALDLGGLDVQNLGNFHSATFVDTSTTLLDTHGVTAGTQITYKMQAKRGVGTLYINARNDGHNVRNGSIIAMEIA